MTDDYQKPILSTTYGVDYVLIFNFSKSQAMSEAEIQIEKLISILVSVGLSVVVRDGLRGKLLVFVKIASTRKLIEEVFRSRTKDWLHGVRLAAPDHETGKSLDPESLTEAERLQIIYTILTQPVNEGGAGITPRKGQWSLVDTIFPLHNLNFNKLWMKSWATSWNIDERDLRKIRDIFGEKVAFYFAFLQTYFSFLIIAAAFGAATFFVLPQYSLVYAFANCLWSVVFVEFWKRQEIDLAIQWDSRNFSRLLSKRTNFEPERLTIDPITGEFILVFPAWKRLVRQALQVPFALGASVVLSSLYAAVFAIEIFISEVYSGPLKSILMFLPSILLTILVPTITGALSGVATKLTNFENYENESSHEFAMIQKLFVFNFITSYVPLFLTAFVYVPFAEIIVPRLDVLNLLSSKSGNDQADTISFEINPDRLRKQVFYFTVTAQVVNLAMETIVPYVKRNLFKKARDFKETRSGKKVTYDNEEEREFLDRVRHEAELGIYDVTDDLREMCMQFGYLCLFAPVWPLAAVSFVINNWIELRSDAAKICIEMRRPIPYRADSIGPWLKNLQFLTWMGSITSAALIYLFSKPAISGTTRDLRSFSGVLMAVFVSEHVYYIGRLVVRIVLSKLDSPGLNKEKQERFIVRRRFLQSNLGTETPIIQAISDMETSDNASVLFWGTQQDEATTVNFAKQIIYDGKKNR